MLVLETSAARRRGSSPLSGTNIEYPNVPDQHTVSRSYLASNSRGPGAVAMD
jgi:hypothetical protein